MNKLMLGDCADVLKTLPDNSLDSLVTDPPAGISFMGKSWDGDKGGRKQWCEWMEGIMRECHRVLKPGAHGLVWALPRTSHWTATALEDAGFEIRDVVTHLFGSGFPKSLDISKAIDKAAGAEREVLGVKSWPTQKNGRSGLGSSSMQVGTCAGTQIENFHTAPATDAAKQWQGFGTALKPAAEFWYLVRKPLSEKTVAANVLKWGTGGLNIDGSRIEFQSEKDRNAAEWGTKGGGEGWGMKPGAEVKPTSAKGRFPANLVLSHSEHCTDNQCGIECAVLGLNSQAGSDVARFFYACGHENIKGVDTFVGKKVENKSEGLSTVGSGNKQTERYLMGTISITEMGTHSIISFPILNASTSTLIGTCTIESGKTIKSLTASSIVGVSVVSPTEAYLLFQSGQQEPITGIVSLALEGISRIGAIRTESIGTSTTDGIAHPSRAFYCAKISASERGDSTHPTMKSQKLMRYLIRMVTPPGGTVLDPFMGSGSTGVAAKEAGFQFIGIEREQEYFEIARARIG